MDGWAGVAATSRREAFLVAVLYGVGVLLWITAGLKAWSLLDSPGVRSADCLSDASLWALVVLELVYGGVLLIWARRFPVGLALATWALFLAFALGNVVLAAWWLCGQCGCLGPLEVSPRWMAVVDSLLLALITSALVSNWTVSGLVLAAVPPLFISTWAVADYRSEKSNERLFQKVEAERWIGLPFPLMASLADSAQLKQGRWLLLLYDGQCGRCNRELADFLDGRWAAPNLRGGVIVLRGPPPPTQDGVAVFSINEESQQMIEIVGIPIRLPVYMLLLDGRVVDVQKHWKSLDFHRTDGSG